MIDNTAEPQGNDEHETDELVNLFDSDVPAVNPDDVSKDGAVILTNDGKSEPLVEDKPEPVKEDHEDDVPDKYRGKSIADIIEMHRNAERELGRKANELHEYKQLSGSIVERQLKQPKSDEVPTQSKADIDLDSLLEKPAEVINSILESHPVLKQLQESVQVQQRAAKEDAFFKKYPNAKQIVGTEHFQEWVSASPVRTKMLREAHYNYDFEMGGELLDLYSQIHAVALAEATEKRNSDAAKIEGSARGSSSSGKAKRQKIYSKEQVIKLMQSDPYRYQQLCEGDLGKAFEEGRVR